MYVWKPMYVFHLIHPYSYLKPQHLIEAITAIFKLFGLRSTEVWEETKGKDDWILAIKEVEFMKTVPFIRQQTNISVNCLRWYLEEILIYALPNPSACPAGCLLKITCWLSPCDASESSSLHSWPSCLERLFVQTCLTGEWVWHWEPPVRTGATLRVCVGRMTDSQTTTSTQQGAPHCSICTLLSLNGGRWLLECL